MARMITNTRELLDQPRHPWQRPELRLIPMGDRAFQEGIDQPFGLRGPQPGLRSRRPLTRQGRHPSALPVRLPTIRHLPGDPQTPGHFGRRPVPFEEVRRPLPPTFQLRVIPMLRHDQTIAQGTPIVTILCEIQ